MLRSDYLGYQARSSGDCNTEQVEKAWHFKNTGMEEADGMSNEEIKQ